MCSKLKSNSVYDTELLGERLSQKLNGGEVIALYGTLGAGKTAFVRGLAKGLSSKDDVSSPTFTIVNEYNADFKIYHFDMYRINTFYDLESTGFFDYLELRDSVIIIEWSENIKNYLPSDCIIIKFDKNQNPNERIISIKGINL